MEIFVDTANLKEIQEAYSWGIVDGVTTNPSLIKQAVDSHSEIEMNEYIKEICGIVEGPVSLEVIGTTKEEMVEQAQYLYETFNPVNDNVVVKIPVNPHSPETPGGKYEGLQALRKLAAQGIPTNTTLIMKPEQALLAAKAGTQYVSPFAGRIDDYIRSRIGLRRGEDYAKGAYHDASWLAEANDISLYHEYEERFGDQIGDLYTDEELLSARSRIGDHGIVSGVDLVRSVKTILDHYQYGTKVLAASLRNSRQVREVAEMGVDVATVPFTVIEQMLEHYKTQQGLMSFTEDVVPEYRSLFEG
ncbi:MAG: transaldolase family protein [Candidatus Acetothermia bacterium]